MSLAYPLLRFPCRCSLAAPLASPSPPISVSLSASAASSADGGGVGELTGRERRQQRRERRELRARDWKEEVQERLIHEPARRRKKPPKRTWREELNLDLLAESGRSGGSCASPWRPAPTTSNSSPRPSPAGIRNSHSRFIIHPSKSTRDLKVVRSVPTQSLCILGWSFCIAP